MKTLLNHVQSTKGTKLVFSPQLAKYLLRRGYFIVGLKENKENQQDVFVFETNNNFGKMLESFKDRENHLPETTNYKDTYLVFDRNLAIELLADGKKIVDLKVNKNLPNQEVYVFLKD